MSLFLFIESAPSFLTCSVNFPSPSQASAGFFLFLLIFSASTLSFSNLRLIFSSTCFCCKYTLLMLIPREAILQHFPNKTEVSNINIRVSRGNWNFDGYLREDMMEKRGN
ncbi:hypothetical protein Ancab_024229 [Ancistrocladus abbreviatus]